MYANYVESDQIELMQEIIFILPGLIIVLTPSVLVSPLLLYLQNKTPATYPRQLLPRVIQIVPCLQIHKPFLHLTTISESSVSMAIFLEISRTTISFKKLKNKSIY